MSLPAASRPGRPDGGGDRWRPLFGAHPGPEGCTFTVWASAGHAVDLLLSDGAPPIALTRQESGIWSAVAPGVGPGRRYGYLIDGEGPFPDPAGRFLPDGVHGLSEVIDPDAFAWTDDAWHGLQGHPVVYELHVGTFTPEGTFAGAAARLPELADLGVTCVQLMPVADFPGGRNWGYDGVALYSPARCYGRPEDLRRFVDTAHGLGLAVHLDVVFNHLGPDGAYLPRFSPDFVSTQHRSPWGAAVNLDGPGSSHVRRFLTDAARLWLHEYHMDGLRLDATHALHDAGPVHFVAELAGRAREGIQGRRIHVVAEDDRNLSGIVRGTDAGGWGLDGVWADDFHHQMRRLLAGDRHGYYADFAGTTEDLATTIRRGWFYVGQDSAHQGRPRGSDPSGVPLDRFIVCLQNHDQVGNRAFGERLHHQIDLAAYRTATAVLLLAPETPLLFMGQEWAASTPFLFFTDHAGDLGRRVAAGRRNEFKHFPAFSDPATADRIPDPQALATFEASRLIWRERLEGPHAGILRLYTTLLRLRRAEPALVRPDREALSVLALGPDTIWLRRAGGNGRSLAVVARFRGAGPVDLGAPPVTTQGAEPPAGADWQILLTTEDEDFASGGRPPTLEIAQAGPIVHFTRSAAIVLAVSG